MAMRPPAISSDVSS